MSRSEDHSAIGWAARRAEQRPFFLATALAAYRRSHGVAEDQLADLLNCPVKSLPALALCRRPDPSRSSFRSDVERIASFLGADGMRLARLLREVDALEAFRGADATRVQPSEGGLLAAARDARTEQAEPPEDTQAHDEDQDDPEP